MNRQAGDCQAYLYDESVCKMDWPFLQISKLDSKPITL